jgi:tetratricopeptide (TPR) repeat protein
MRRITLLVLMTLALTPSGFAQEAKGGGKQVDNLLPYQKAFFNLPEKQRVKFIKTQEEAKRLFDEKRIIETLEILKLAEKEFPESPDVWNLRGSCYVELRSFEKALSCFNKAVEIAGKDYRIVFNIGEVYFVTQQWQKSHDIFADVLKDIPQNRLDLRPITEFKVMLCKIKLNQKEQALILADKYDFLDDSPYHYFAKAVLAYDRNDVADAEQWMARAARIFRSEAILAPWHDTLVEFGYIKSFYGGDK